MALAMVLCAGASFFFALAETALSAGEYVFVGDKGKWQVAIGIQDMDQDVLALPFCRSGRAMPVRRFR